MTSALDLDEIARRWTAMWNGEIRASDVVTADARLEFGRTQRVPGTEVAIGDSALQAFIDGIRQAYPDIVYSFPTKPLPAGDGRLTLLWDVVSDAAGIHRTGIDILEVRDGTVIGGRSVTGDHAMSPLA